MSDNEGKELKTTSRRGRPKGIPNPHAGRKVGSTQKIPQDIKDKVIEMNNNGYKTFLITKETGLSYYLIKKIIKNSNNENSASDNSDNSNSDNSNSDNSDTETQE